MPIRRHWPRARLAGNGRAPCRRISVTSILADGRFITTRRLEANSLRQHRKVLILPLKVRARCRAAFPSDEKFRAPTPLENEVENTTPFTSNGMFTYILMPPKSGARDDGFDVICVRRLTPKCDAARMMRRLLRSRCAETKMPRLRSRRRRRQAPRDVVASPPPIPSAISGLKFIAFDFCLYRAGATRRRAQYRSAGYLYSASSRPGRSHSSGRIWRPSPPAERGRRARSRLSAGLKSARC